MTVKQYEENDLQAMITIWNDMVEDGQIVGLYILHPNNVGRCGHLCNASYAVDAWKRGAAYRRKTGKGLSCTGKKNRISGAAV